MTLEELLWMIAAGLTEADDEVRAAWAAISVPPEKWKCSPWGDENGGFWVVAISGDQAIWYNDVEEGFNSSPFSRRGVLDAYWCNQDSFPSVLRRLQAAQIAEGRSAPAVPAAPVPRVLQEAGTIVQRQTTYWTLRTTRGARWRVRFVGKVEIRFSNPAYPWVRHFDEHPALAHHNGTWSGVYLASPVVDHARFAEALSCRITEMTGGWRCFGEYLNQRDVLQLGYGLLMSAPDDVVAACTAMLQERGTRYSVLPERRRDARYQALVLGPNLIVATAFRFEPVAGG